MTAPNRLVEWLPDSLASARPSAPGQGVYLHRATDTGAITLWDGAAWRTWPSGGGTAPTEITFTGQTFKTFTPTSFPCFVEIKGRAIGATGRWFGTIDIHVPQASAPYTLDSTDVDDLSQGFLDATSHLPTGEVAITIDAYTGAITITFPEAVTGQLTVTTA